MTSERRLWTCPSEETWTRFLLVPDLPEGEQLVEHLEYCEYCQVLVQAKEKELAQLTDAWHMMTAANVIHLSPFPEAEDTIGAAGVMAAKGIPGAKPPDGATLVSPKQDVLLRVVRDRTDGSIWLYLLAEAPEQFRNAILKPFGEEQEYVTDDEGRVNLGVRDWPGPGRLTAEVHLPTARFTLQPMEEDDIAKGPVVLESSGGERIEVTYEGDRRNRRLRIRLLEIRGLDEAISLKMAIRIPMEAGISQVQTVTERQAVFDEVEVNQQIEIYVYQ